MQSTIITGNRETAKRLALSYCSRAEGEVWIIDALHVIKGIEGTIVFHPHTLPELYMIVKNFNFPRHVLVLGLDVFDTDAAHDYEIKLLRTIILEWLQKISTQSSVTIALLRTDSLERTMAYLPRSRILSHRQALRTVRPP
jgi:hypothetical protein